MVEVLKTNVKDPIHADFIIQQIHKLFPWYKANFDLEDSDRILRVEPRQGEIEAASIINLLNDYGYEGEILPDEYLPGISFLNVKNIVYPIFDK